MEKMLLTIVIFLLFLGLLTSSTMYNVLQFGGFDNTISLTEYSGTNSTEYNSTIVRSGSALKIPAPPICVSLNSGLFFIDLGGSIACGVNYVVWMASLATVQSDIQWLGFLFIGLITVLVIIIIKIISGLIPFISGVRD